ncbi:hypothetical protein SKAU_G00364460 [Synaphobranchus kaupii]|uniref:Uncharacterized protein n=1 Tax=Synaphobranchus kaupii TaxID=118154 RepID=A0A9Q1EEU1_SYNKA|nr:hypothetical protein SKAU_G00364460 [Synaphobranchus kaupii]
MPTSLRANRQESPPRDGGAEIGVNNVGDLRLWPLIRLAERHKAQAFSSSLSQSESVKHRGDRLRTEKLQHWGGAVRVRGEQKAGPPGQLRDYAGGRAEGSVSGCCQEGVVGCCLKA